MTTIFDVQPRSLGYRGHLAASVHGTEGAALPQNAAIIDYWADQFFWESHRKPIYILKVGGVGGTDAEGVADQLKAAKARGFKTVLQIRDDEAGGRSHDTAIAYVLTILDLARDTYGVIPDVVEYGNEPEFNNREMTWETNSALLAAVYDGVKHRVPEFVIGGFASWQQLPKKIGHQTDAVHADLKIRTAFMATHHYQGQPSLVAEHDYAGLMESLMPTVPLVMAEGDHTATGGAIDAELWSNRGAAFAVDHNLTLAAEGIACCDFVLQNAGNEAGGNGFFRKNGTAHPSGTAMVDIVGPFTREPMLQVDRDTAWDSVSAFANRAGEFVITNHVADVEKTIQKWMNMSAGVTDVDHVVWADVWSWLQGGAQPSYPGQWEPSWGALSTRHAQAVADDAASSKSVLLRLPEAWKHVEVIATVFDGVTEPTVQVDGLNLTASMPKDSVVFGRVW